MLNHILVMFGGALSIGTRFWASGLVARRIGEFFPLGTLAVYVTESFIIEGWAQRRAFVCVLPRSRLSRPNLCTRVQSKIEGHYGSSGRCAVVANFRW
jgi:hypothetical protein